MTVKAKIDAIDSFIRDLKTRNLWDDIGTAAIMTGWTNIAGALTPLKGAAPTNNGFSDSDLDSGGIGLKGNGSSKWIGTNRLGTTDNQNDVHESAYMSAPAPAVIGGSSRYLMGSTDSGNTNAVLQLAGTLNEYFQSSPSGSVAIAGTAATAGLRVMNRTSSTALAARSAGMSNSGTVTSVPRSPYQVGVYGSAYGVASATSLTDATLSWYSIGSSLSLSDLDAAVSSLMSSLRGIAEAGFDRDALSYIRRVEEADGSFLETEVKKAINRFFVGTKKDGTFESLKASCILCGARTLAGALVPLVGDAPTSYNFASGDYDRETGLVGDGSTKYLDSNRAGNASDSDDTHLSLYFTSAASVPNVAHAGYITNTISPSDPSYSYLFLFRDGTNNALAYYFGGNTFYSGSGSAAGFFGVSAVSGSGFTSRLAGAKKSGLFTQTAYPTNHYIFARNNTPGAAAFSDSRLAFYSIGSAISDLALLDNRVTNLITEIAAAIP